MRFEQAYDPVRCLQASWELLKRAPATIVLGALVPVVVQYALGFAMWILLLPMFFSIQDTRPGEFPAFFPVFVVISCMLGLGLFVLQTWIDVGYARAVRDVKATQTEQLATVFRGGDRLLRLLWARFLTLLALLPVHAVGLVLLLAAGVFGQTSAPSSMKLAVLFAVMFVLWCAAAYVMLGFQFVTQFIALEDCTATEAIGRSWRLASGRRWRLILYWLLLFLVMIVGFMACGVGVFLALPLIETMRVEAFLALKDTGPVTAAPTVGWGSAAPPPPPPV